MKNILLAFAFLLSIASCKQAGVEEQTEVDKIDHQKLVKEYFQHFNNHDWEAMAAMHKEKTQLKLLSIYS